MSSYLQDIQEAQKNLAQYRGGECQITIFLPRTDAWYQRLDCPEQVIDSKEVGAYKDAPQFFTYVKRPGPGIVIHGTT